MVDLKLLKLAQRLIKLRTKKEKQLKQRTKREKHLQELADREYKYNKEQWEALQCCIKHQQNKRLALVCDLLMIKQILAGVEELQKETHNDWYA